MVEKQRKTDTVNQDGDVVTAAPKKRGRPPKNQDGSQDAVRPKSKSGKAPRRMQEEDGPSVNGVGKAVLAVPSTDTGAGADDLFKAEQPQVEQPKAVACASNPKDTWPTRSTFAGRPRGADGSTSAELWDARRANFYADIPREYWKDSNEREYWRMCVECEDSSKAVQQFMDKVATKDTTKKACAKAKSVIWLF